MTAQRPGQCTLRPLLLGWLALWAILAAIWTPPVLSGVLPDTDDYMRMVRVFALRDGTGDRAWDAPRLGLPPDGTEIGWSRLLDWPLTAIQAAFETVLPRLQAAYATATLAPALALLAFWAAALWTARPVTGGRSSFFVFLATLCVWGTLRQFMPGRVDHHMIQLILTLLAFGTLIRLYAAPGHRFYPLLAGGLYAVGLAVGIDILPWLALGAALVGFFWLARGTAYEQAGLLFGAAAAGGALALHIAENGPDRLTFIACDFLSPAWLAMAAAVPAFWGILRLLPAAAKSTPPRRFLSGATVALPLAEGLLLLFPGCFHDPYQIRDPLIRTIWLDKVLEAQPLPVYWAQAPDAAVFFALPPLAGLAGTLWAVRTDDPARHTLWAGLALVLAAGLALAFFGQIRIMDFVQAIGIVPLAWLFIALTERAGAFGRRLDISRGLRLALASLFFCAAASALPLAAFYRAHKPPPPPNALQTLKASCSVAAAAPVLNALPAPLTIAAPIDAGAEILFRTPHRVLAAPYHRNQDGLLAVHRILAAPNPDAARAAMRASGARILMICDSPNPPPFAATALDGRVPDWLVPLASDKTGGFLIYKTRE